MSLDAEFATLHRRLAQAQEQLETERKKRTKEQRSSLLDLLQIADALDRLLSFAAKHRNGEEVFERLFDGAKLTREMFLQSLLRQGVTRLSLVGQESDPDEAEVIAVTAETDLPNDFVVSEVVAGYRWREWILRKAEVVIAQH